MIIHIVVGGPKTCIPLLRKYDVDDVIWIGADRGVYYLLEEGIVPKMAFGDFDSVSRTELNWIKGQVPHLDVYPKEKDETDMELALGWALKQKPEKICILGATGGRMDHALANIQLLKKGLDLQIPIYIIDEKNIIFIREPGKHLIHMNDEYPYVSFLPLTAHVEGIFLEGFKYSLTNRSIAWGSTLCISNELVLEKGTYSFSEGIIIVIRSKD